MGDRHLSQHQTLVTGGYIVHQFTGLEAALLQVVRDGGIEVVVDALKKRNAEVGGIPYPDAEDYRSYANK